MDGWSRFESELQKRLPASDEKIIRLLDRKFHATTKEFRCSERCSLELRKCIERITKQPYHVYHILNGLKQLFKDETKASTDKIVKKVSPDASCEPQQGTSSPSPEKKVSIVSNHVHVNDSKRPSRDPSPKDVGLSNDADDDSDVIIVSSPEQTEMPPEPGCSMTAAHSPEVTARTLPSLATFDKRTIDRRRALVSRLERLLGQIAKKIRELEETELNMDTLDSPDSPYVQLDVLKRRYLDVWHRLCAARKVARISGRILRRRFRYTGCRYATVNRMIEELVNDRKCFPDMVDVRHIVSQVNKEEQLKLSSLAVTELARHVFIDVGHRLKQRRQSDFLHDFGCYLTDGLCEDDDPTYGDSALRRRLAENRHLGNANLNSVFDKYVQLQQSLPSESLDVTTTDDDPSLCSEPATLDLSQSQDSEQQISNSDKPPDYDVVSLSSSSDESTDLNNCAHDQDTNQAMTTSTTSLTFPAAISEKSSPRELAMDQIEPVIDLSDDDDSSDDDSVTYDTSSNTSQNALIPVTVNVPTSTSFASTRFLLPFPPTQSNCPSGLRRVDATCTPDYRYNAVYPIVHETRSVTVTQQCHVDHSGVRTSYQQHTSTTSRVLYPPFANVTPNPFSPTVCISSVRSLSTGTANSKPSHSCVETTESHPRTNTSRAPSSSANTRTDYPECIVLD